jgi:carboxypeptidase PM20D1
MIGILEAVNFLLKVGFQPKRTVYLAFGEDEEVSGVRGAAQIVKTLKERDVRLSFLLDEGGVISQGSVPGIDSPVGLVGVAEKGHLSLVLRSETAPGHASAPGEVTSIGALALAIATLENNPFPQDLDFVEFMMSFLADELPFTQKMQLANRWLFGKAVAKRFAATPITNANTRTTIAPTVIKGGHTENVLPAVAEAMINLRLMPGDTLVDVYKHVNELVGDDVVQVLPAHEESLYGDHSWDPTEVSDVESPQFNILLDLIKATIPGAVAAPYLMSGATDARHYMQISDRVYRFSPFVLNSEDTDAIHGINERLSFENAARMVGFMIELIERMSSIPTDFYGDEEEEEDFEDEEAERRAIRKMDEPLPTRPMRKPEVEEQEILPEEDEVFIDDEFEPLPEDDEPLITKPLKEE